MAVQPAKNDTIPHRIKSITIILSCQWMAIPGLMAHLGDLWSEAVRSFPLLDVLAPSSGQDWGQSYLLFVNLSRQSYFYYIPLIIRAINKLKWIENKTKFMDDLGDWDQRKLWIVTGPQCFHFEALDIVLGVQIAIDSIASECKWRWNKPYHFSLGKNLVL